jgi:succinoglycan biosynthesis protein ExoV
VILYRWQGVTANFGDELNTILWPHLLPDSFDENPEVRFLGIGSVLDHRHPPELLKVVAGSGYGGYERKPTLNHNWKVHWVRGPRTATALDLPIGLGLGDPAALVPSVFGPPTGDGGEVGFMPHFESAGRGAWYQAAAMTGIRLIDPRDPPLTILRAIGSCGLLLSEALHGVIVADALRVPWVAVRPMAPIHRAKWFDWADTVDLRLRFRKLPASTLAEWAGNSWLRSWHHTRVLLSRHEHRLEMLTSDRLVARAARALRSAAQATPQLSSEAALDRCQSRMLDAVQAIRVNPLRTASRFAPRVVSRSRLRASDDSAYHLKLIG